MRTTTLGSTGPEVGVIGLGCMGMTFSYDMETPRDLGRDGADGGRGQGAAHRPVRGDGRRDQAAQAVHPVTSVQSELSLWTRDALAGVLPYCQEQGIAFLPFAPLGRGFLTGRFASSDDLPQDDFRRGLPRFQREALRANLAIVARVRQVAGRAGATPAQVALAWVLAQGPHVVPIPGTKTPRYLADNAGAADVVLSAADLADLDALPAPQGTRY
jgi:aryl-alcohol dehydrogenase-like predicted oxidoreductase